MKVFNNRKVAAAVLIVCMLGSIVGFGGGSLAQERRHALRVFDRGIDESFAVRFSMDAYLDACAEYARTMAEEFRLHVDAGSEKAARMLELSGIIGEGDLHARCDGYIELNNLVESVYTDFDAKVEGEDASLFKNAYQNYQGEVSKIGYDEYHGLARDFNELCGGFPASALCGLLGIDPLHTF